jgi:tetratricopeptide (TPR) repeat protein
MFRRAHAFPAGAVAALAVAAPAAAEEAPDLVAKGRVLLGKGDGTGAREAFAAALKKDGKSVEARRGAAEASLLLGQPDEAVDHAFAGLSLVENRDAGLWLLAARGFLLKGDSLPATQAQEIRDAYADARAKGAEALKRDPGLTLARVVVSKALRLTGDSVGAATVLEEGLAKSPEDFDLLFEQGFVNIKRTDYAAALGSFTAAAAADPKSGEAHFQKGFCLLFLKRASESYACFVEAAIADPANRKPLQYLGKYAKDGSVPHLRAILKARPDHAWAHAYLAFYLAHGKDEAGALAASRAAQAAGPKDVDLVAWHGQVLEILGKAEEGRAAFRKALETNAACSLAYTRLFDWALNPGSKATLPERKEWIDFLTKVRPEDGALWNNVGLFHRDMTKDYRKSLEAYLKSAALSPDDQGFQNDTGLIYLYHGKQIGEDPAKGLPFFEKTLSLVDDDGQSPLMGFRDTLENLAHYYMTVEKNPEKALLYAERRNDPEFLKTLPKDIAGASPRAAQVRQWAEGQLKK